MLLSSKRSLALKVVGTLPFGLVLGLITFIYIEYITTPSTFIAKEEQGGSGIPPLWQIGFVFVPFHLLLGMLLWSFIATTFTHPGRVPHWYTAQTRVFDLPGIQKYDKGLILVPKHLANNELHPDLVLQGEAGAGQAVYVRASTAAGTHREKTAKRRCDETDNKHTNTKEGNVQEDHETAPLIPSGREQRSVDGGIEELEANEPGQRTNNTETISGKNGDLETGNASQDRTGQVTEGEEDNVSSPDDDSGWLYVRSVPTRIATLHPYGVRWCAKCGQAKPPRSHHCHVMNECVLKMDHYCPWVSNCVGFRNYKQFYLFLVYGFCTCLFVALTWFPSIMASNETQDESRFKRMIAFVLVSSFTVSLICLGGGHSYFISTGKTTLEIGTECEPFPFDFGTIPNWKLVMGKQWKEWFLPMHPQDINEITLEGTWFTNEMAESL